MADAADKKTNQPPQQQEMPGKTDAMRPRPDHGEESYEGSGRLTGKRALITGGDSGIGRAVAIAFAREGADVLISYLSEHEDATETGRWIEKAGFRTARESISSSDTIVSRASPEITSTGARESRAVRPSRRVPVTTMMSSRAAAPVSASADVWAKAG